MSKYMFLNPLFFLCIDINYNFTNFVQFIFNTIPVIDD